MSGLALRAARREAWEAFLQAAGRDPREAIGERNESAPRAGAPQEDRK